MSRSRVVEGRVVTPVQLAELVEGESVFEAQSINDTDRTCPAYDSDVLVISYMPSMTVYGTAWKCQSCEWRTTETV